MSWTHLSDTKPKARKNYHCELCGLIIPAGEIHTVRAGAYEGRVSSFRMHSKCVDATKNWTWEQWEEPIDAHEFRRMLEEAAAEC